MKIFTLNQDSLAKLLTAVILCSLLMSVFPLGVFSVHAEDVPIVSETLPAVEAFIEPPVTTDATSTPETIDTDELPLPFVARVSSVLPLKPTETVVINGDTAAGESLPGWMFNRDITTATPFSFNIDEQVIGTGALNVLPIGANAADKFVGEYFVLDKIANVLSYTYDFKIGAGGTNTDKDQFYLNVYANYGVSSPTKFYDCRYSVVPTVGSTGGFATVTFDPTQAYPVTTRSGGSASPFTCPAIPADMNLQSSDSTFRAFTINLGDTSVSDVGIDGYFDNVVLDTIAKTTTFDFEPAKEPAKIKVHILKYLQNGEVTAQIPDASLIPSFPMTATWNAANIGAGTGNYVLGNTHGGSSFRYGADTSAMSVPADYTTSEITGGDSQVLPIGAACSEGKYRLVGYKAGDDTEDAEAAEITAVAPVYTELDSDRTIIVVNESCDDIVVTPDPVCEIGENLLQNGSFETPTVTDHSGQWEIFSTVANWVISLSDGLELWKNFNGTGAGLASDGIQNAELDGNDATKISQTVTTIPGATYELTFDFSPRAGVAAANNKLDALVGGSAVLSLMADGSTTTANTWRPQTYSFVATSTSTTIAFEDKGIADEDGGYGPLLDNAALCVTRLPKPTGDVTMCKIDEQDVPQSGWTLTLLGEKVEDIVVPTNTSTGINSVATLGNGKPYVALASGTWNNQGGANQVDTEYSATNTWATHMDGYTGYGTDILELQINSAFDPNSNWGAYNNAHTYAQGFTQAATATANFRIFDGTGTTVNEGWYGDNSGTLNVSLYKGYTGITGENGCVTFTDVPFGTYTAGEIMQDGWNAVSGAGPVDIGYNEPTITLKNARDIVIEVPSSTHTISGVKWNDVDGDGMKDEGEPNLSGWAIRAVNGDTTLYATTSGDGSYSFVVTEGTWTISEMGQEGWTQTGLYQNDEMVTLGSETPRSCSITTTSPLLLRTEAAPTPIQYAYFCDFGNKADEQLTIPEPTSSTGGGSSSGSKAKKKPTPQVLGAATSAPQCGMYLTEYMKQGAVASSTQVTKLQIFLNAVEIKLPVTGIFDDATDQAVRAFQLKHKAEVLTPWFTAGIVPHDNPTGWVYQLTRWKINNIVCPGSEAYPTLN